MGKSGAVWTVVNNAKRGPPSCIGCGKRIVYGDRCPPCATELRIRAAKRRRKR
jgi:hypothetical protein